MNQHAELTALAREILDTNLYVTLGTVADDGSPWTSPVACSVHAYRELYWMSAPGAEHSRNLLARPRISGVVFDSSVAAGEGRAVYLTAYAEELSGADVDLGVERYPGPLLGRLWAVPAADLRPPARYRLYRATIERAWVSCPRDTGRPCAPHGLDVDHRYELTPWAVDG